MVEIVILELTAAAFAYHGADELPAGVNLLSLPGPSGFVGIVYGKSRISTVETQFHAVQRISNTDADRFSVPLLSRPAGEKGITLPGRRLRQDRGGLVTGELASCNAGETDFPRQVLQVYPHLAIPGEPV